MSPKKENGSQMNEIMSPWGNFFPSEVSNVVVMCLSYQVRPKHYVIPRISSPPNKSGVFTALMDSS